MHFYLSDQFTYMMVLVVALLASGFYAISSQSRGVGVVHFNLPLSNRHAGNDGVALLSCFDVLNLCTTYCRLCAPLWRLFHAVLLTLHVAL